MKPFPPERKSQVKYRASIENQRSFSLSLILLVLLTIYLGVLTNFARAEEAKSLSIKAAISEALDRNADVLKAREAIQQSESEYHQTISKLFPTVNGYANWNYIKDAADQNFSNFGGEAFNQYQVGLKFNQPLYDGAVLGGLGFAKKGTDIKKTELEIAEKTISESVIETYYTLLLNERLLQILNDTYAVDVSTLKAAENYYRLGRIQKVDFLQLKTQTALLKPKIAQAENQIQVAASQLATLLHHVDAGEVRTKGALVTPDPKWVKEQVEKRSKELPEITAARLSVDQFEDGRSVSMAAHLPKLSFVGQYGRLTYVKTDLLDSNATNWMIGLQLTVPIFTGLSSLSERSALASQQKQLELTETKLSDTVFVNEIQTEKDVEVAQTQMIASEEAARFGEEGMKEAEKDFKLSTISYIQYQSSLQAYLDSESNYYQSKYRYIVAIAKYFNAIGVPISNLISKLDELSSK